jgi:hypothetical protein
VTIYQQALRRHAATGTCTLSGCHHPTAAHIDSGDPHPTGICADHRPEAHRHGYITRDVTDTASDEACPVRARQRHSVDRQHTRLALQPGPQLGRAYGWLTSLTE